MDSFGRRLRIWSAKVVPSFLGRWVYVLVLWVLKLALHFRLKYPHRVWARHSYSLGTLTPFLSDLDLTIYFTEAPPRSVLLKLRDLLKIARRICPIVGEVNLYVGSELQTFLPFANPLEIDRDPILLREMEIENRKPSDAERLVFLIRTLESDMHNLQQMGSVRRKKWLFHAKTAKFPLPKTLNFGSLANSILESAGGLHGPARQRFREGLERYRIYRYGKCQNYELLRTAEFQSLFPNRIGHYEEVPPCRSIQYALIMEAQLRWEVWGLYSQLRQLAFDFGNGWKGLREHTQFLKQISNAALSDSIGSDRLKELEVALDQLSHLYAKELSQS